MMSLNQFYVLLLPLLLLFSCKPEIPDTFLQPDEMESVLYDWYIAQGMAQTVRGGGDSNMGVEERVLLNAVLKKHNLTHERFDTSMVYYMRHTEMMKDIYTRLAERMGNQAVALGANQPGDIQMQGFQQGDSTDIWRAHRNWVMSPKVPANYMAFEVKPDTSYHAGDRFVLSFMPRFIYQDGIRDAQVVLAIDLKNDSTVIQSLNVSSSTPMQLMAGDENRRGIRRIRGFFLLNNRSDANVPPTTLQLLSIGQVRLLRIHTRKSIPVPEKITPSDSSDITRRVSSSDIPIE